MEGGREGVEGGREVEERDGGREGGSGVEEGDREREGRRRWRRRERATYLISPLTTTP